MFYDFSRFKNFVEKAREIGIEVPIIPGIKPIKQVSQLSSIPRLFHISFPNDLVDAMESARTPEKAEMLATAKMVQLCQKLIDFKVPAIHFYTMGTAKATKELLKGLLG